MQSWFNRLIAASIDLDNTGKSEAARHVLTAAIDLAGSQEDFRMCRRLAIRKLEDIPFDDSYGDLVKRIDLALTGAPTDILESAQNAPERPQRAKPNPAYVSAANKHPGGVSLTGRED